MKIKNYKEFLFETNLENDEIFNFHISSKLNTFLEPLKNDYKIAKLLYELQPTVQMLAKTPGVYYKRNGPPKNILVSDPIDYLDIDNEGNISFLKSRYFSEENKWENTRRVKTKITKVLKEIYNQDFLREHIKETDAEAIVNKIAILKNQSGARVEEFRGEDVLRGYNYNHEFNKSFGHSCANFHQKELGGSYREPWVDEYDVYVKNPENCGVVVVWDNNQIVARRSFQQGIQVCDTKNWKKGEFHTVWGNYYGIGGNNSKYDTMIKEYLIKKYDASDKAGNNILCIEMETRWKNYPAFDSMYVNFEYNLLTNNYSGLPQPYISYSWVSTYSNMDHLHAPENYIKKRLQEEYYKEHPEEIPKGKPQ